MISQIIFCSSNISYNYYYYPCSSNRSQSKDRQKDEFDKDTIYEVEHFNNFEEFIVKFATFKLPKGWSSDHNLSKEGERLTIFKIEYSPGPCISWAIV